MERVVLNVGGKRFETTRRTLLTYPNSLLGRMFAPENEHLRRQDDDGSFFFDANGEFFERIVLDAYRNGFSSSTPDDDAYSIERIQREYDYWQLSDYYAQFEEELVDKARHELLAMVELPANVCDDPLFDIVAFGITAQTMIAMFETLEKFCDAVPIIVTKDGLFYQQFDSDSICLLKWALPATSFAKYSLNAADDVVMTLSAHDLSTFLKSSVADCLANCSPYQNDAIRHHAVRFCMNRKDMTQVCVQVFHEKQGIVNKLALKIWAPNNSIMAINDLDFAHCVRVDTELLRSAILDFFSPNSKNSDLEEEHRTSERIVFRTTPCGLVVEGKGFPGKLQVPLNGEIIKSDPPPLRARFSALPWDSEEQEKNSGGNQEMDSNDVFQKRRRTEDCAIACSSTQPVNNQFEELKVSVSAGHLHSFFVHALPCSSHTYVSLRSAYPLVLAQCIGENDEGCFTMALSPFHRAEEDTEEQ